MPEPSGGALPHLRWSAQPDLPTGPVLIAAFGGWNDAGDAATTAIDPPLRAVVGPPLRRHRPRGLLRLHRPPARRSASTSTATAGSNGRPTRSTRAPPPAARGLVTLSGVEPQLQWRTFCDHVLGVAVAVGARHGDHRSAPCSPRSPTPARSRCSAPPTTRPTPTTLELRPSRYEGPDRHHRRPPRRLPRRRHPLGRAVGRGSHLRPVGHRRRRRPSPSCSASARMIEVESTPPSCSSPPTPTSTRCRSWWPRTRRRPSTSPTSSSATTRSPTASATARASSTRSSASSATRTEPAGAVPGADLQVVHACARSGARGRS